MIELTLTLANTLLPVVLPCENPLSSRLEAHTPGKLIFIVSLCEEVATFSWINTNLLSTICTINDNNLVFYRAFTKVYCYNCSILLILLFRYILLCLIHTLNFIMHMHRVKYSTHTAWYFMQFGVATEHLGVYSLQRIKTTVPFS